MITRQVFTHQWLLLVVGLVRNIVLGMSKMAPHRAPGCVHVKRHDLVGVDLHDDSVDAVVLDLGIAVGLLHTPKPVGFKNGVHFAVRLLNA